MLGPCLAPAYESSNSNKVALPTKSRDIVISHAWRVGAAQVIFNRFGVLVAAAGPALCEEAKSTLLKALLRQSSILGNTFDKGLCYLNASAPLAGAVVLSNPLTLRGVLQDSPKEPPLPKLGAHILEFLESLSEEDGMKAEAVAVWLNAGRGFGVIASSMLVAAYAVYFETVGPQSSHGAELIYKFAFSTWSPL